MEAKRPPARHTTFIRKQGGYLQRLLQERLRGPNSLARPYTFDIRGGGGFWCVEFDFDGSEAAKFAFDKGLIILGMSGGANLEGTEGEHLIL